MDWGIQFYCFMVYAALFYARGRNAASVKTASVQAEHHDPNRETSNAIFSAKHHRKLLLDDRDAYLHLSPLAPSVSNRDKGRSVCVPAADAVQVSFVWVGASAARHKWSLRPIMR